MEATMLLCDAAQVADGKLYVMGGGWSMTGPTPTPSAIAVKLDVAYTEIGFDHPWTLSLEDADGHPVTLPGPDGEPGIEVAISGSLSVDAAPDDVPPGAPVDVSLAVNVGPLPLAPARRYRWRLSIDGRTQEGWSLAFSTRPEVTA